MFYSHCIDVHAVDIPLYTHLVVLLLYTQQPSSFYSHCIDVHAVDIPLYTHLVVLLLYTQQPSSFYQMLVGVRFSAPVQTGPGAHPASCTMVTGSFPGVKSGRGVTLTPHPLLVPWSRKGRAIPLHPLWALRPVESLSACTRGALYPFFLTSLFYLAVL